jgi:methionyl-tRNA formyltransferase
MRGLLPNAEMTAFSFREEPHEPPFIDDISTFAATHGIAFHEARQVGAEKWRAFWTCTKPDLLFCVNWRYIVPQHVIDVVSGAYVFHDSLLPAYRGFSPTVWAIANGESSTGVTLFEMAEGVDSGAIVAQKQVSIGPTEEVSHVMERVTEAYLDLIDRFVPTLVDRTATATPQDHSRATYTCRRTLDDNRIDWTRPAREIFNLVRATTHPYPGAFTHMNGTKLTIWSASLMPDYPKYVGTVPGRVTELRHDGVVVLTGEGALLLRDAQREGGERALASTIIPNFSTLGQ